MMEAGKLRHLVTIQQPTQSVSDTSGETINAWQDGDTIYAHVRPLSARENLRADQTVTGTSHIVTTRFHSAITPGCRLKFGARILDVTGIINVDERNVELQIMASEAS